MESTREKLFNAGRALFGDIESCPQAVVQNANPALTNGDIGRTLNAVIREINNRLRAAQAFKADAEDWVIALCKAYEAGELKE